MGNVELLLYFPGKRMEGHTQEIYHRNRPSVMRLGAPCSALLPMVGSGSAPGPEDGGTRGLCWSEPGGRVVRALMSAGRSGQTDFAPPLSFALFGPSKHWTSGSSTNLSGNILTHTPIFHGPWGRPPAQRDATRPNSIFVLC